MPAGNAAQITAHQKANWDNHAYAYDEVLISKDLKDAATLQVISAIKSHKELVEGAKILDIASSSGRPSVPVANEFPNAYVTSTDLSPKSVSLVLKHAQAEDVTNLTAQAADAQNLVDFADSTFSVVTCSYGLFCMPEATKALREAYRVLQPGGLLVIVVWAWPDTVQLSEVLMASKALMNGKPIGFGGTSPMAALPWDISSPRHVQQALKDAHFTDTTCTEFQHPIQIELPDMVKLVAGSGSHHAQALDSQQALGQAVHEACSQIGRVEDGVVHLENTSLIITGIRP